MPVADIVLYVISLAAAYLVLARFRWSRVIERPEGLFGILIRTLVAMIVFAGVFRIGIEVLLRLGLYGSGG